MGQLSINFIGKKASQAEQPSRSLAYFLLLLGRASTGLARVIFFAGLVSAMILIFAAIANAQVVNEDTEPQGLPGMQNFMNQNTSVALRPVVSAKKSHLLAWNLGLDGESYANQKEQAQVAGLGLNVQYKQLLLPNLMLKIKAGAALQSGYAQSQFGDNTPKSGILLQEAVMQYRPFSALTLQTGAIDQSYLNAPLLVSGAPFPGVLEKLSFGSDRLGADLIAEQTIPTSTTLSTRTVSNEQTPYFLTEILDFKWQPFDVLKLKAFGGHYSFTTLPSSVAQDSESYGNTVIEEGPNSSQFAYGFDGWLLGSEGTLRLTRTLSWKLGGHIMQNSLAPVSYRNAQLLESELNIGLPGDIDFKPNVSTFFAESDVAPGFYNSSEFGHNNRQGWSAGADVVFKKAKFKVGASYASADLIDQNTYQTKQQYIQLRFESLYEIL